MQNLFSKNVSFRFELRSINDFYTPKIKSINYGQETIRYLGPKIWNMIPQSFREASSLSIFKNKIKSWIYLIIVRADYARGTFPGSVLLKLIP